MKKAQWTLVVAFVAAVLNWAAGFGWSALTPAEAGWVITAINAVALAVAAWKTRPIPPSAFTYAITSLAGLLGAYGLHLSQQSVSGFSLLVLAFLSLITNGQVSPSADTVRLADGSYRLKVNTLPAGHTEHTV